MRADHCACVTSNFPMAKDLVRRTWCAGFSSGSQSLSPSEQPIRNVPGWMVTNSSAGIGRSWAPAGMTAHRQSRTTRTPDVVMTVPPKSQKG
jgi:hypothetical protein